jgi:hypothetical protein
MSRPLEWYPARLDDLADKLIRFAEQRLKENKYPVVEGFLARNDISVNTFYEYVKTHEKLGEAYRRFKALAKESLVNGAMENTFNANFSKFVAINNHDMRDGVTVEHSGSVGHDVFLGDVIRRATVGALDADNTPALEHSNG